MGRRHRRRTTPASFGTKMVLESVTSSEKLYRSVNTSPFAGPWAPSFPASPARYHATCCPARSRVSSISPESGSATLFVGTSPTTASSANPSEVEPRPWWCKPATQVSQGPRSLNSSGRSRAFAPSKRAASSLCRRPTASVASQPQKESLSPRPRRKHQQLCQQTSSSELASRQGFAGADGSRNAWYFLPSWVWVWLSGSDLVPDSRDIKLPNETTSLGNLLAGHSFFARSRRAFPITLTDDNAIAAAAMIGERRIPKSG